MGWDFPVPLSLPALIVSAFLVSLATVAVPGPITLVISRLGLSHRIAVAISFLGGCLAVDVALFTALAAGAAPVLRRLGAMPSVEMIGGLALLWGGISSLRHQPEPRDPRHADRVEEGRITKAFLVGILVCLGNVHYWFWWITAGMAFVEAARAHGYPGLLWILVALIGGVVAWYAPLLWALHHGRTMLSPRAERLVVVIMGGALVALGAVLLAVGATRMWNQAIGPL